MQGLPDLPRSAFPLVNKYFNRYFERLRQAAGFQSGYDSRFLNAAFRPEALEERLERIEQLDQTRKIVAEIGSVTDPVELDKRLLDAWAELRALDQLLREGFENITKVTAIADFTAARQGQPFAFQVTRVNKLLESEINRRNKPEHRSSSPFGKLEEIHGRLDKPTGYLFWDRLQEKNGKLRNWRDSTRCIIVLTNQAVLQDTLQRHIACQQIRQSIHDLPAIHFEQLYWLPDNGNGALFEVGETLDATHCFVNWQDEIGIPKPDDTALSERTVKRREVDLSMSWPSWKNTDVL